MTFKDFKKESRGPWLLTLLDGKAWDAVEHLSLTELATADGERMLWETLSDRFPEKEQHDVMGEVLGDVFGLVAAEGESMKVWTARVKETFDICKRKASVEFPPAARGWVALHCAGLNEEQKAIVKAKTHGSLDHDAVSAAFFVRAFHCIKPLQLARRVPPCSKLNSSQVKMPFLLKKRTTSSRMSRPFWLIMMLNPVFTMIWCFQKVKQPRPWR